MRGEASVNVIKRSVLKNREMIFLVSVALKMIVQTISIAVIPTMVGTELSSAVFKVMTYSS